MTGPQALLLDVGNTAIKWRFIDDDTVKRCDRCAQGVLDSLGRLSSVSEVLVSSVSGPDFDDRFLEQLRRGLSVPVTAAVSEAHTLGLSNSYARPEQMGVDRWLAMVGAWHPGSGPVLVIDAGTAITLDLVSAEGLHEGGYIVNGIAMMRETLTRRTGRVRFDDAAVQSTAPGKSTAECVTAGAWLAGIAAISQVIATYSSHRPLLTGGDAEALLKRGVAAEYRANLVLDGLARWARSRQER